MKKQTGKQQPQSPGPGLRELAGAGNCAPGGGPGGGPGHHGRTGGRARKQHRSAAELADHWSLQQGRPVGRRRAGGRGGHEEHPGRRGSEAVQLHGGSQLRPQDGGGPALPRHSGEDHAAGGRHQGGQRFSGGRVRRSAGLRAREPRSLHLGSAKMLASRLASCKAFEAMTRGLLSPRQARVLLGRMRGGGAAGEEVCLGSPTGRPLGEASAGPATGSEPSGVAGGCCGTGVRSRSDAGSGAPRKGKSGISGAAGCGTTAGSNASWAKAGM